MQVYLQAIDKTIKSFTIDRKIPESVDSAMLESNRSFDNSMSGASEKNENKIIETSEDNGSAENVPLTKKKSPA
jgi:hypothetical protein